MDENTAPDDPLEQLALAHTPSSLRGALQSALALDRRLSQIVARTSEPMLGQMRLAWWRDVLGKPLAEWPQGNAELETIALHWGHSAAQLAAMADGWEYMLSEPPLSAEAAMGFASGRAKAFGALANISAKPVAREKLAIAAQYWALGDGAVHIGSEAERATMRAQLDKLPERPRLGSPFKGIAIMGALGERALRGGEGPLMEGRGAAITALKSGLFGR